jgi:hypothetical protein
MFIPPEYALLAVLRLAAGLIWPGSAAHAGPALSETISTSVDVLSQET